MHDSTSGDPTAAGTTQAARATGPFDEAGGLASAVAANRRRFLEVELEVGNTMLDAAAATQQPEARLRRVARAREAHDEVARHLASDPHPAFTPAERRELAAGLSRLRARLADAG